MGVVVDNFAIKVHTDNHHIAVIVGKVDNSVVFGFGKLEVVAGNTEVVAIGNIALDIGVVVDYVVDKLSLPVEVFVLVDGYL